METPLGPEYILYTYVDLWELRPGMRVSPSASHGRRATRRDLQETRQRGDLFGIGAWDLGDRGGFWTCLCHHHV